LARRKQFLVALLLAAGWLAACSAERVQPVGLDRRDAGRDAPLPAGIDDPGASAADATADATAGDAVAASPLGESCTNGQQCASGLCVDGVCCNTACTEICEACDGDLSRGTCTPTIGPPRAPRGPCWGDTGACAGFCDGTSGGRCRYPGPETTCAAARCENGVAAARAVCSGGGQCTSPVAVTCAPFTCDGDLCAGGCNAARPCTPDSFCGGGRCFPRRENGAACESHEQCQNGACVDGRCCAQTSCGVCAACLGPQGTCTPVPSGPDPDTCASTSLCADGKCRAIAGRPCKGPSECLSGFCAQGRCCNAACTGACQSCNLAGSAGTCTSIPFTSDARNCGGCGVVCPGTRCQAGACEKVVFSWSSAGAIAGQVCVNILEAADPYTWNDNFLCTPRDFGLRWSSGGPIAGMTCTQWLEPSDPFTWNDNFLCAPVDYGLRWSAAGPLAGMRCTQILEAADPHTWNDNYLCAPP
jgi:hypothetical protein